MHPVRYGCPPEVTRFVLRPAPVEFDRSAGSTIHGRKDRSKAWDRA
jgi:hypothetical protein